MNRESQNTLRPLTEAGKGKQGSVTVKA